MLKIKRIAAILIGIAVFLSSCITININAAWSVGENLATSATVTASMKGSDDGSTPNAVNDGVIESGGTGKNKWFVNGVTLNQWIEFEFKSKVSVGGVKVVSGPGTADAPDCATDFSIQYYTGSEWKDACTVSGNSLYEITERFPEIVESNKFRYYSNQNNRFRIREIELYEGIDFGDNTIRMYDNDNKEYKKYYEMLINIGLIEQSETFDPEAIVTKEDFVHMLLYFTNHKGTKISDYKSSYADAEESKYKYDLTYAEMLGYIGKDKNTNFYPKREITYNEATQMILSATGYDFFAEQKGGYPNGYVYYASQLKLGAGVSTLKDGYILYGDVITMLYNASSIGVYEYVGTGNKTTVSTQKSLLEYYYDIHKVTGVIYARDSFGIPTKANERTVKIGNEYYDTGYTDAAAYVGYSVEAWYVDKRNSEKSLLYVAPSDFNNILTIDKKDVMSNSDFSVLNYYESGGDKTKSVKIDYNAYVFLNDELGTAYTDDLYKGRGKLLLIDNDGDNSYDVIFIKSYLTMVVASISDEIIYDRLSGESVDCGHADTLLIYKNGERVTLRKIEKNDVLLVEKNSDLSVITIYASDKCVRGTVDAVSNGENNLKVSIDGKDYEYVLDLNLDLSVGMTADFRMDHDGKIVFIDNVLNSEVKYGLMLGIADDGWRVKAKILTTEGTIKDYFIKDKVICNNSSINAFGLLIDTRLFTDGDFCKQVIKYRLNKDDEIDRIYLGEKNNPETEPDFLDNNKDELIRYKDADTYYGSKEILGENNMGRVIIIGDKTVIFEGPLDDTNDFDEYSVRIGKQNLKNEYWYGTINVYDLLYNDIPNALFFKKKDRAMSIGPESNASLITDVSEMYDPDTQQTLTAFTMLTNGVEETVLVSEKCKYNTGYNTFKSSFGKDYSTTDFSTLSKGDMIQCTRKDGEIISLRILEKATDLTYETEIQAVGGTYSTIMPTLETAFGSAYCDSDNIFKIKVGSRYYSYKNNNSAANIYIYDSSKNKAYKGRIDDIVYLKNSVDCSKVFVRASQKVLKDVLVIK